MAERRDSAWVFLGACAFALAVLVGVYSNSFKNSFHFDDSHVVEDNLYIRSLKNVPLFFRDATTFSSLPANAAYRPLVTTSLAFDYWLAGGLQVRQFHLSQLVILIALGAMLVLLFLRLFTLAEAHWWNRYVALLAALSFCVHATNTETMNLIHARSELLSAMGVVGSFLVYLYLPRARRTYLYLVPMVVGALAKNQAVVFAPLLFAYLLLFEQRLSLGDLFSSRSWRSVGKAIGSTLPAIVVGAVVFAFVESMNAPGATYGGGGRREYLQTQLFVWLHYARLFLLPVGLTADTDWKLIAEWYDTRVIAGILFVALLVRVLCIASTAPVLRPVAFGIAWFLLTLLPASSIFPLAEVANEHRVFLPFIGLSLALIWRLFVLADRTAQLHPGRRKAIGSVACAVVLVFIACNAAGTYERNKVWRSAETLWRDVTEKSPANGRGLMNYGLTQMRQGKYEEAKRLFERAQALLPGYASLEINLGVVTDRLGQPEVAERHFSRALALAPDYPPAHFFYARWLAERNRSSEAIGHLQRAVRLSPADIDARYLLLELYAKSGQSVELAVLTTETLKLVPGDPKVTQYVNDRGEPVVVRPETPPSEAANTFLNTSLRLYQAGDFQGSIAAARSALDLEPGFAEAYNNIGAAFAALGEWDEAIDAARAALELKPDFPLARNNLAWALAEKEKATRGSKQPGGPA